MIYFGADIKSLSFNGRSFAEAYLGPDLVWKARYEPVIHNYTKANTYYVDVPRWANAIDYVLVGGGGGGSAGDGSWRGTGDGGYAGSVKTGTSRVPQGKITVVVGAGGSGSSNTAYPQAESGGNTSISIGSTYFSASGGRGGRSNSGAHPAGARQEVNVPGFRLPRGRNTPVDSPGIYPGNGGGGGSGGYFNSYNPGQRGADGLAWLRFRRE